MKAIERKKLKKAALEGLLKYKQTLINTNKNEQNEPKKK